MIDYPRSAATTPNKLLPVYRRCWRRLRQTACSRAKLAANGLFVVCLLATVALYFPGLDGGYVFDDTHVIESNPFIKSLTRDSVSLIQAADSFAAGGRELSMLSFALNHYFFGDSPWWYKFVNLLVHCLNGLGLFFLSRQLLHRGGGFSAHGAGGAVGDYLPHYFALAVAALWLVHPLNLIPVLYVSQRMTLLSAFFVVYGLIFYIWARGFIASRSRKLVYLPLGIAGFTIFGFKCKENAVLLPFYILILEWLLLKFRNYRQTCPTGPPIDKEVVILFCLGALVFFSAVAHLFIQDPAWVAKGYDHRYFSMGERVLTQFRVLVFYIGQILAPANSRLGLWHDDFGLSTGLLSPVTTIFSLTALAAMLAAAFFCMKKWPLPAFGILWFFVSHSLESTVLSLELMHEHRNYLASFGILLAVTAVLARVFGNSTKTLVTLVLGLFLAFAFVLHQRAEIWSDDLGRAEYAASHRPDSAAAQYELGKIYYEAVQDGVEGAEQASYRAVTRSAAHDPYTIIAELLLVLLSRYENIEYQSQWLRTATDKLRQHPYMAPSQSALSAFYRCLRDGQCILPPTDAAPLFDAAFNSGNYVLLTTAAAYYTDVEIDYERAEQAFKRALHDGTAITWVNYLNFLLYRKKFQQGCTVHQQFEEKYRNNEIGRLALFVNDAIVFKAKFADCKNGDQGR